MVARLRSLLALLGVALALVSCDFFASPLPGFLGQVTGTRVVDLSGITDATDPNTRFDLAFVTNGTLSYLLLRVSPPADPETFAYSDVMIVMDPDGNEIERLETDSTLDYMSRPFGIGIGDQLLVGYSLYDLTGPAPRQTLTPHGLEGFLLSEPVLLPYTDSYLISTASGLYSSFHLEIRRFDNSILPDWPAGVATQLNIVPDGLALSSDPSQEQNGYQLLGVTHDDTDVTFLLSRPSARQVVWQSKPLTGVVSDPPTVPEIIGTDDPVDGTIDADRPRASVDADGFFLVRRNGWFERYNWDGDLVARVAGDTSFGRYYAFNVAGDRFYRYDPETSTLSTFSGWW
jgi:hypothetical protein